ncbi:hypothetical protein GPECTOR_10g899 [Gonium pectorale]|uniref:FAST kinase leucine-rich domain-containing protein n=1 Tax=Gonium pectorale TaxID=33097 RepID=A0A150GRA4_GONPE|nr:hypothetical protein GPECTOR_10g899 [Gonium pectorale]|eukprot:KXZ52268.1 hypothetical protein GPECTOR_10g899 [Gonium pectorale]
MGAGPYAAAAAPAKVEAVGVGATLRGRSSRKGGADGPRADVTLLAEPGAASSGLGEVQELLLDLLDAASPQAPRFEPRQLANMLWAAARVSQMAGRAPSHSTEPGSGPRAGDLLGEGGEGNGSCGVAGEVWVGRLRPHLEVLLSEAVGRPVRLSADAEVTETPGAGDGGAKELRRAAGGGEHAGEDAAAAMAARPNSKLMRCSVRELANVAWAAAQLGVSADPVWEAVRSVAAAKLGAGGAAAAAPSPMAGGGAAARNAGAAAAGPAGVEPNAADLANLAWALARAQRQPGAALGRALVSAALARVEALAAHVAANAAAYCGPQGSGGGGSGGGAHTPDDLARMLQALVRCAGAGEQEVGVGGGFMSADGADADGARTDLRVARRVERALEAAARQVVRSLPRTSPEGLTALAVAYATPLTTSTPITNLAGGLPRGHAAAQPGEGVAGAAAGASGDPAGPSPVVGQLCVEPLPPAGPRISALRATVLRATLRATLRLLAGLAPADATDESAPPRQHERQGWPGSAGASSAVRGFGPARLRELVGALGWCVRGLGSCPEAAADLLEAAPVVQQALPLCAPAELALLSVAFARAGCHPPALMADLSAAARAAAPQLSALDVSQLAWAAAAGGGSRDALLLSVLEQRAIELLRARQGTGKAGGGREGAAGADGAWGTPGQELANMLWAFAKLAHYSEPLLDAAAAAMRCSRSRPPLGGMRPLEVAMAAAALGELRYFDASTMELLAGRVAADAAGYTGRVLCWALSSFAALNVFHPQLLRAATERTRQLLAQHRSSYSSAQHAEGGTAAGAATEAETAGDAAMGGGSVVELPPAEGSSAALERRGRWKSEQPAGAAAPQPEPSRPRGDGAGGALLTPFDLVTLLWCFGVLQHVDAESVQGLIRCVWAAGLGPLAREDA